MRLLNFSEKEGTCKVQSDKFIGYNKFKCHLPDDEFDRNEEWWFPLNKKHLTLLPKIFHDNRAKGSYGIYRDDPSNLEPNYDKIRLIFCFNDKGISFEADFDIDILTGIVEFALYSVSILKDEFIAPLDMHPKLLNALMNEFTNKEDIIYLGNNMNLKKRLFEYTVKRYMKQLKSYVEYLENLNEELCEECVYKVKYRLSPLKECKEIFLRNKFSGDITNTTSD